MTTVTPAQHLYHHTVPQVFHNAFATANAIAAQRIAAQNANRGADAQLKCPDHRMHKVDPENKYYVPFDHITAHPIGPRHPTLKYRIVAVGAGPAGVIFLLKLVELLHEKARTHHIDCKIVLIEKREHLEYGPDRVGQTKVEGIKPTRKDIWTDANTAVWPKCLDLKRFRNVKGEWTTFKEALQSDVEYTILRHDLLIALSQLCHQVFSGKEKRFHPIFGNAIHQESCETAQKSILDCITKHGIADFLMDRGTFVALSWGWRHKGAGDLMMTPNVWTPIARQEVRLKMLIPTKSTGTTAEWMRDFSASASALKEDYEGMAVSVNPGDSRSEAVMSFQTESAMKRILSYVGDKRSISFSELPHHEATYFLKNLALRLFQKNLVLVGTDSNGEIDLNDHKIQIQLDRGTGYWSETHTRSSAGTLFVLVGSARISAAAQLVEHSISACLLAQIAEYAPFDTHDRLENVLKLFETYSTLSVQYQRKADTSPMRSGDSYYLNRVLPLAQHKLQSQRLSIERQLDSLTHGILQENDKPHVLHVPAIPNWSNDVYKAFRQTFGELLKDPDEIWHPAYLANCYKMLSECGVEQKTLEQWQLKSQKLWESENANTPRRLQVHAYFRAQMDAVAKKIGAELGRLAYDQSRLDSVSKT